MNQKDVIRMAHEAGLHLATDVHWMPIIGLDYAEKFAAVVAAAEREACARECEIQALDGVFAPDDLADAIRARGNKT